MKERTMGDKGSKKDKDKVKRQQVKKDKRDEQKRLDKAPVRHAVA